MKGIWVRERGEVRSGQGAHMWRGLKIHGGIRAEGRIWNGFMTGGLAREDDTSWGLVLGIINVNELEEARMI